MMNPKVKLFAAGLMITLICFFTVISAVGKFTALSYGSMGNAEPHSMSVDGGEYGEPQAGIFAIVFLVVATVLATAVILAGTQEEEGGPESPEPGSIADLRPEYQQVQYTDVLMAQLN